METARLVRLTQAHKFEPGDRNAAVLCDADLAILGASPERYRQYAQEVRREYAEIPDEAFRPGRAEILRSLLEEPTLFRTAAARERYEERARANLTAEIEALTS
jgi:predicted metal-dependent HD superfamily phosphohydrolase